MVDPIDLVAAIDRSAFRDAQFYSSQSIKHLLCPIMFNIKPQHARRVSFVSKLFPKLSSVIGLDISKLKAADQFDGVLFAGGRSKNRDLLTYLGFIRQAHGGFIQLPLFRRSLKKLVNLVELELENAGAQEILAPTLVPQNLWYQSKRIERQKDALNHVYKLTDNSGNDLLLGPTFEETVTRLLAGFDNVNELDLPIKLYQTSPKFRYEPNPRFGVIRTNEFLMNDLYTFDANFEKARETYESISQIYDKIFKRLELKCLKIQGETGNIGGEFSHEYQLPVSSGEDTIVKCGDCQHASNMELCHGKSSSGEAEEKVIICPNCRSKQVKTAQALELGHTFLLSTTYSEPLGAKYISGDEKGGRRILEMGCYGLGLTRILGAGIDLFSQVPDSRSKEDLLQLRWPSRVEPYDVGIVSPAKRSESYHKGSTEFIEQLVARSLDVSRDTDVLVEDREKEGIGRRVIRLKSLGIPNIVVIGKGFLKDEIEIEMLKLDADKKDYEQSWLSEDQFYDYVRRLSSL